MPAPIAFYFDFISPYGYFASLRIEELAARLAGPWMAADAAGVAVLKVMGLKPLLDTPLKGDYIRHDVRRRAGAWACGWGGTSALRLGIRCRRREPSTG